jgi:uncharacterized membrane protein
VKNATHCASFGGRIPTNRTCDLQVRGLRTVHVIFKFVGTIQGPTTYDNVES